MSTHAQRVPQHNIIQPLCGASGKGGTSSAFVPQHLRFGQVYGHIHHRLHTFGELSHQAHAHAQDNEGTGSKGQVHNGLVLRIQAAPGHQ